MFGIGKKQVTEKTETKETEQEASDEIQFDFEEKDKLPFDDEEDFGDEEFAEEPARKGVRQALSSRTLLLALLLLLVLGGGGYYFLVGPPASPPSPSKPAAPVKAKVKVQPVKVQPATPAPETAVKPASPAPVVAAPVKGAQSAPTAAATSAVAPPAKKAASAATAPTASEVKPASPTSVAAAPTKGSQSVPTAAVPPAAVVTPAAPAPVAQKVAPAVAAPPAKDTVVTSDARPATRQPFTISAGTFVSQKNLRAVEKKIRSLGYTPKVQTTYGMVPMTRLLLGVYDDPAAAQVRSRELSKLVPGLFSMKQGDSVALYAGSYQDIDQARRYADQLFQLGILADEETVSLRMPVKNVSYGSFASRAAAEKAAKRAVSAGLDAQVVKR